MPPEVAPSFTDLSHNAVLAITGDDATAFLQGQLTNDVEALGAGEAQLSGWCSPKGRLLTTLLLAKRPDGYLAMLPTEIAPAIAKRLAMFVLRSNVKIRDASAEYGRHGIFGAGAREVARHLMDHDDIVTAEIAAELFVVLARPGDSRVEALRRALEPAGIEAWDRAVIRAGIPTIVAATQEAFVPQMANFDRVGGVSFKKGCYTGQEIVARTQYRGILKRRMALAHAEVTQAPAPGQSVYSPAFGDQAAGAIANVAPATGGGFDLLVVAQVEAIDRGDLRLADGRALRLLALPYAVPRAG